MSLRFDRFRFDRANQRLEDDAGRSIPLNPKAFDVLAVLLERRGSLVSKDELLDAVWRDASVADGVLKVSVAEIRKALGDSATTPRFIETVHRRGYRFVAAVAGGEEPSPRPGAATPSVRAGALVVWPPCDTTAGPEPTGFVGRGAELATLDGHLTRMLAGERQIVFVTGEAGAGKTALVEHFVGAAAARHDVTITGSQCIEHVGPSEAYMPVLEALGRLARARPEIRPHLRRFAPTWLSQLPWLVEEDDRDRLGRELLGTARERMLREMAELVEAISAEMPLIVVIDDAHWSDPSTIDLLSVVAGRREPARFLGLMTYRPAELVLQHHPLRAVAQRLSASRRASEVTLDDLHVDAVAEYLERRFPGGRFPAETVRLVRKSSDGNPLFLVTLVDHLLARGAIVERDGQWQVGKDIRAELAAVPESLRRLIQQRLERLDAGDRELLAAASLVGVEFSSAAAAAGAAVDLGDAEQRCDRLSAAGTFLRATGAATWPDGTTAGAFAFRHPLYREELAASVPARRRTESHARIAGALERAYGATASQLAAELAVHFEEGGDPPKALPYRLAAAHVAEERLAFAEAESHLARALATLETLPPSESRDREEVGIQSRLGAIRMLTRGYSAPEVGHAYTRALELAERATGGSPAFPILWGIWAYYASAGEHDRALELAERNLEIADANGGRLLRLQAHHALWTTHYLRGDFAAALRHLDVGEPLYEPDDRRAALVYGMDPKMAALGYRALVTWVMGDPDRAVALAAEAVAHTLALEHPLSVAQAMLFSAWVRQARREPGECLRDAEAALAYSATYELPFWMPNALQVRGWALVELGRADEGMAEWRRGIELWSRVRGAAGRTAYEATLAEAHLRAGRLADARGVLDRCKALIETSRERYFEADIHRIDAALVLAEAGGIARASAATKRKAEALLRRALGVATGQGARAFELRAATALAYLRPGDPSRTRLAAVIGRFPAGSDGPDLQEARGVLATY
jgi:DNA-binding winged helix-turn-helix (wHTH) protein/predicted ATPase